MRAAANSFIGVLLLLLLSLLCQPVRADEIKILVVYETRAFSATLNKVALANAAINQANAAVIRSSLPHTFTLAHVLELAPVAFTSTESSRGSDQARFLEDEAQVDQLRDQYAADLVLMFSESVAIEQGPPFPSCGYADAPSGRVLIFHSETNYTAVLARWCMGSSFPPAAHEIGHLLRAEHEANTDGSPNDPVSYNHAHYDTTRRIQTLMAGTDYSCTGDPFTQSGPPCTVALQFSSPSLNYPNVSPAVAAGSVTAHNKQMINGMFPVVARYRPLPQPAVTLLAPTCALEFVGCAGSKRRYLFSFYQNDAQPFPLGDADYSTNGGSTWYDLYGGIDACVPIVPATRWDVRARVRSAYGDSGYCTIQIQSGACSGEDP